MRRYPFHISQKTNALVFLICCHHTSIFLSSAIIDRKYLDAVTRGELGENQFLCIKRSVKFDLAEKQGILDGSRAVIGLFRYLMAQE